jgi:hypothetical protein
MTDKIPDEEMDRIRAFVRKDWNAPYLGRGTAERMESLQRFYAKRLDEEGLTVAFVPTGNDNTLSEMFLGKKGYYKRVEKAG